MPARGSLSTWPSLSSSIRRAWARSSPPSSVSAGRVARWCSARRRRRRGASSRSPGSETCWRSATEALRGGQPAVHAAGAPSQQPGDLHLADAHRRCDLRLVGPFEVVAAHHLALALGQAGEGLVDDVAIFEGTEAPILAPDVCAERLLVVIGPVEGREGKR